MIDLIVLERDYAKELASTERIVSITGITADSASLEMVTYTVKLCVKDIPNDTR